MGKERTIPKEVHETAEKLVSKGYQTYLVGGCVRDILIGKEPKDWDVATNARPEEVQKIFKESVYENKFGTVGVKTDSDNPALKVIEVTTFRIEGKYTDQRHPDEIKFAKTIEEDLSRRDFTINAIALNLKSQNLNLQSGLTDPFDGQKDLENKLIRAVGNSEERFIEDALRLMRAVRFTAELEFSIEEKTADAIKKHASHLGLIAKERVRDEFIKLVMADCAEEGIRLLEKLGLLKHVVPELQEGIDCAQNKHHIYTVWEHNLRSLKYTAEKNYSLHIRLAALLHDVGKPRTKAGEGPNSTFYNHEIVGAKITARILDRLRFSKGLAEKIIHLVRYHLFYYNVGEVTEAGVRRFLRRVGPENVDDFINVREADRIGSGVPKAVPYKLRHLLFMIDKVKRDPISHKMLAVSGDNIMKIAGIEPGPKVGQILAILLEEVIENPKENKKDVLENKVRELADMPEKKLEKLTKKARGKKDEFERGVEEEMKKQHYVK